MMYRFLLILNFLLLTFSSAIPQGFQFIAMSDSRGSNNGVNEPVLSAIAEHIVKNQKDARFVVFAGDMVAGNRFDPDLTYSQLQHWKKVMSPIYNNPNMIWPKVWVTVGNHEVQHRDDEDNFRKLFPDVFMNGPEDEKGLTYSFDYENSHFVFVTSDRWHYGDVSDTTDDKPDRHYIKHLDWLEKDLQEARSRGNKHIFVISHEPAFPIGGHLRDGLPNLGSNIQSITDLSKHWYLNQRNRFWDILSKYKVTAYINGHEHSYGRQSVNGVYQINAGSCGAPLYEHNPKYGDNPAQKRPGQELIYNDAVPYYKALNYNFGPNKNSQASKDFVGYKAFNYVLFNVFDNHIDATTYGGFPKEGSITEMGTEIKVIDRFKIEN
ncbi:MAG: metallophosphoesterase [Bacteroidetes bacterium]|nr:metallophosphoesterase [Bacteroidota bacterium]MBU2584232.1 metallophosphoesterase [Bacteroidota bacterium]